MSTGIEWTDETWNPVVGCTKVSQGCKNCYAKTLHDMRHVAYGNGKMGVRQYAEPFETVQLIPQRLSWPETWRKPRRIFVNSMSDLFHEDVPDEFVDKVFAVMAKATRHSFQILTKRPARMLEYFRGVEAECDRMHPYRNVWLGVSVENKAAADERIPLLLQTPAAVRFLSCEPLLGPVDLSPYMGAAPNITGERVQLFSDLDWVIVGGESGSSKQNPRPMHPDWARSIRDRCVAAGVPFLFKQWGEFVPADGTAKDAQGFTYCGGDDPNGRDPVALPDGTVTDLEWNGGPGPHLRGGHQLLRLGKKRAGRELDGRTWDQYPRCTA